MRFDAVIFDFDGTLVDSAGVKYDSFFELFPATEQHRAVVKEVLVADPDGSRHVVIPRMVEATAIRLDRFQFLTIRQYLSLVFAALVILLLGLTVWP